MESTTLTPDQSDALIEELRSILDKYGVASADSFIHLKTDQFTIAYDRKNCLPPCKWIYLPGNDPQGNPTLTKTCVCPGDANF